MSGQHISHQENNDQRHNIDFQPIKKLSQT